MKTTYRWEKLATVLAEPNAADLIRSYVEELSPIKHIAPVDPDWDLMQQREGEGVYKLWCARVEGTLAGYISFNLMGHPSYRGVLFAFDAGHYLSPAFRDNNGRIGYRMWRTVEPRLKGLGVKVIWAHDNAQRPLLPFMLALGYEPRGTMFTKVL